MVKWGVQLVASELPRDPGYYNKWLLRHKKSGCVEYIRTGMVQMDASLSLCDHRRITELMHRVGLR